MAWLRQLGSFAANILLAPPPNKVIEVATDCYSGRVIHCRDDSLLLYRPSPTVQGSCYEIVLQRPCNETITKAYSLCRCDTAESAELWFNRIADKVPILFAASKDVSPWPFTNCTMVLSVF